MAGLVDDRMVMAELRRIEAARLANASHDDGEDLDNPAPHHFDCGLCGKPEPLADGENAPWDRLCRDCSSAWVILPGNQLVASKATVHQIEEMVSFLLEMEGAGLSTVQLSMLGQMLIGSIGGILFRIWPDGRLGQVTDAEFEVFDRDHFWTIQREGTAAQEA